MVSYPEDKVVLDRYLGPSIDVGPALTAKILKDNGQIVPRSTYPGLTPEEIESPLEQAKRKKFDEKVEIALGPKASLEDFQELDAETPIYDSYEDDADCGMPDPPSEELEPTPEAGDSYVNTEVMLPRGDSMARGRVVYRKRDADGNLIGWSNANPILDSRLYEVEFANGEVAKLTANVITEAMFAQCDENRNEYILLDSLVDHKKGVDAMTMDDQKIVVNGRPDLWSN